MIDRRGGIVCTLFKVFHEDLPIINTVEIFVISAASIFDGVLAKTVTVRVASLVGNIASLYNTECLYGGGRELVALVACLTLFIYVRYLTVHEAGG